MKKQLLKLNKLITSILLIAVFSIGYLVFFDKDINIAEAGWWNDGWNYRKAIIINHAQVVADQTNFPMLVSLTDTGLGDHAQDDGDDIIFVNDEGEKLSHEIESFATSTGVLVAWVKMPTISSTHDEEMFMYYGNAGVETQQDAENVWDDNYMGVWHLNEATSTLRYDSTGNGNTLTDYNNVGQYDGKMGNSALFTESNDSYLLRASSSLNGLNINGADQHMTISAWIAKASDQANTEPIAGMWEYGDDERQYLLALNDSSFAAMDISDDGDSGFTYAVDGEGITVGAWRYLTGNYDDTNVKIFLDGQQENITALSTGINNSQSPFAIGAHFNSGAVGQSFDGVIDEVRVSNIDRSENWTETEYNNQNNPSLFLTPQAEETGPGPVGYWSFNEGYGSTAHDESSGGNNGTITGATWKDESECVAGKCLYFDGVDQGNVLLESGYSIGDEFTACTWIKANSLINVDGDSSISIFSNRWGLSFNNSGILDFAVVTSGAYPEVLSRNAITENKWYHICGVFYGIDAYPDIFVNGIDDSDDYGIGGGTVLDTSDNNFRLGAAHSNEWGSNFNGYMDEVKIYPYARTADQIKQDYNAGLAGVSSQSGVSASFGGQSESWLSDGLVGYWKMDESATTTGAIDSSGNGNDGAYEGTASTTGGKFGRGGVFDGDSDYIIASSSISSSDSDLTFSMFVKTTETSATYAFDTDGGIPFIRLAMWYDNFRFWLRDSSYNEAAVTSSSAVNNDNWHMVTGVLKDNTMKLYINGILETENSDMVFSGNWDVDDILIGTHNVVNCYEGNIDEVRIYNRALSKSEVQKLYEWAPGPVMHLKMDEKSGATVYDVSGNENNGTVDGALWGRGKYGGALDLDGDADLITVTDANLSSGFPGKDGEGVSSNMSLMAWVYLRANGNDLICKYGGSFCFWQNSTGDLRFTTPGPDVDGLSNLSLNQWTHIALTYDGSNVRYYIDGTLDDTDSFTYEIPGSGSNLQIGDTRGSDDTNGLIDDVRIYNYARTQKQILEDMHNGNPMKGAVLDLSFDEGVGGAAHDNSIFKNNGTLYPGTAGTNTATSAMWSLEGKNGGAMEFDGTDDYIDITNQSNLDSTTFSVSFWVNPDAVTNQSILISNIGENSPWEGWALWMDRGLLGCDTGDICLWTSGNSGSNYGYADYPYDFPLGEWTNWLVTYDDDNKNVKFYINNKEVFSDTVDYSPVFSGDEVVTVGGLRESGYKFDGEMDDVKMWSYVLNEEEIAKVYNSGKAAVMGSGSTASDGITQTNSKNRDYCVPGDTATCDPPVLELKMDEKSGATAYDTSGNGNDGTISGASWGRGKIGSALSFNGSDDYVKVDSSTILDNMKNSENITIEGWINYTGTSQPSLESLFSLYYSNTERIYIRWTDDGDNGSAGIALYQRTDDEEDILVASVESYPVAGWHYISWTIASGTHNVFIDGTNVLVDQQATKSITNLDNGYDFYVGYMGQSYFFEGLIDNVYIYDYVRTSAQIAYDYNKGKPIAHYSFNECSGSTIHDESGNGNHGTLNLGASGVTATGTCASSSDSFWYNGVDGKIDSGGSFDGGSDYVELTNFDLTSTDAATVAFWFKTDILTAANKMLFEYSTNAGSANAFYINMNESGVNGCLGIGDHTSSWNNVYTNKSYADGNWHHFLGVINRGLGTSQTKIYIDGIDDTVQHTANDLSGNFGGPFDAYIISRAGTSEFLDGQVDELKIWNYALTSEQIKGEYNGGAVRFK